MTPEPGGASDRFVDPGATIYDFLDEMLVSCPRCAAMATVRSPGLGTARLICAGCGLAKDYAGGVTAVGGPVDPFFGLPLWLAMPCRGEILWAYNEAHLSFLEAFVGAKLRQRPRREPDAPGAAWAARNRTLASRLPRWLTSAKARDDVSRALAVLRARLPAG